MWLAFLDGRSGHDLEQVLPQLAALAQFAAELRGRLARQGIDGLEGTLALYRHLKGTLDAISSLELQNVHAEIEALVRGLREIERCLEGLGRLKRALVS